MPKKIIFLDCETTGLDEKDADGFTLLAHEIHSIIELSYIIDIDGKMVEKQQLYARPRPNDVISKEALNVNGRKEEEILNFPPQKDLYTMFLQSLGKWVDPFNKEDKFWFLAYNAGYDDGFVRQLFSDHGDTYYGSWFWVPCIDIKQIVGAMLMESDARHLIPNVKLTTVAKYLDIAVKEDNFHDGLYDCRILRSIYYKLVS